MNIPKPKNKRVPTALLTIACILLCCLGGFLFWLLSQESSTNSSTGNQSSPSSLQVNDVDYGPASEEDKHAADKIKEQPTKSDTIPPSRDLTVTITRAYQGTALHIRTLVNGPGEICVVELTKNGQEPIKSTFPVRFEATSANCNGDIDINNIPVAGEWLLSIAASSGSTISQAATQIITITKS